MTNDSTIRDEKLHAGLREAAWREGHAAAWRQATYVGSAVGFVVVGMLLLLTWGLYSSSIELKELREQCHEAARP